MCVHDSFFLYRNACSNLEVRRGVKSQCIPSETIRELVDLPPSLSYLWQLRKVQQHQSDARNSSVFFLLLFFPVS